VDDVRYAMREICYDRKIVAHRSADTEPRGESVEE